MIDQNRFPIDPWALRETSFNSSDLGVTETLFTVANGYLGMRGNTDEGRDAFAHGTFINGFHETWPIQHAEEAFGFAKVGQTIVNAPDTKTIRLYVDDEPLLLSIADVTTYERRLDFRTGVLSRELIWRTPSGKHVQIKSKRMVSFAQRHLAVMTYEVSILDDDAPVAISSQILNRQDGQDEYRSAVGRSGGMNDPRQTNELQGRVLNPKMAHMEQERYFLGYQVANSGMTVAIAADHQVETENSYKVSSNVTDDLVQHVVQVDAKAGVPIKLTKVVTYHSSRGAPVRELAERCRRTLDRVKDRGVEQEFAEQRSWLDAFWARSDVEIGGDEETQQAIRWNLFQLAQATARAEGSGIAAKGLTGSGYSGHYFWDTEIYVLPFLTYTSPDMARNALRFRYTMLDAARARARDLNQNGALFPWRTINGEEASAYYAAGTAQYHIDADVSHALLQYLGATGDYDFLHREGIDILVETARMWADLGFWRGSEQPTFHIHGVTGPDEYTTVVNDNLFTNVMARANLRRAAGAVRNMEKAAPKLYAAMVDRLQLQADEVKQWEQAAAGMHVPYDEALGVHPQDDQFLQKELWDLRQTDESLRPLLLHFHPLVIYRLQVLKQADVVLAMFLQGDQFSAAEKRANFDYYDPLTTGDSTLSAVVQAIIAAEVGYEELALEYFHRGVMVDLKDLHKNTSDGVHVASTGGVWAALVNGFGGMRDHQCSITFDPRLPTGWDYLRFTLTVTGVRVAVEITAKQIEFRVIDGELSEPLQWKVQGKIVTIGADEPVQVKLRRKAQLTEAPTIDDIEGAERADGTQLTAWAPEALEEPAEQQ